jgi:hypothetical protein
MSKYILDPSGKIIIDGEVKNPGEASQEKLQNQEDYFSSKSPGNNTTVIPSTNALPAGLKGLTGLVDKGVGIVSFESGVKDLESDIFPSKKNSQGNENLLVNPSFGYDKPVKYYSRYNSIFAEGDSNRAIYAEELEMIAGIEFNSAGLFLQTGPNGSKIDISLITYIFDYLIESIVYLSSFWFLSGYGNDLKNNLIPDPIKYYFDKLLNSYRDKRIKRSSKTFSLANLIKYFIIGFDKFINTDPKYKNLYKNDKYDLNYSQIDSNFELLFKYIGRTLTGISKIGRNRFFLLIRKFQQESYWHSEILYKAKEDSKENIIDKFFIQFSQYYFKFILERINIGYLIIYKDNPLLNTQTTIPGVNPLYRKNSTQRLLDPSRTIFDKDKDKKDLLDRSRFNNQEILFKEEYKYKWKEKFPNQYSSFNTSITTLPQLLKATQYFKHKLRDSQNHIVYQNFSAGSKNSARRLPQELVEQVESYLDNEYMPFYLHDLRTNEIVSMHAFLDTISDSFSPEYSSTSGYGRIDDVKHYVKTTRSINLTFSLYSMQSEDFDLMWYQVNKIVSMVYPQWSQGIPANTGKFKDLKDFRFPFTQVPTASPLIRLRVGDVLKSNYSLENLKRLHGNKKLRGIKFKHNNNIIFNSKTKAYVLFTRHKSTLDFNREALKQQAYKSVSALINISDDISQAPKNDVEKIEKILNQNNINDDYKLSTYNFQGSEILNNMLYDLNKLRTSYFKNKKSVFVEKFDASGLRSNNSLARFIAFSGDDGNNTLKNIFSLEKSFVFLFIEENDTGLISFIAIPKIYVNNNTESFKIEKDSLIKDQKQINIFSSEDELGNINNPYTKAFESSKGKGLAGFITSLDVNYQESVWNTNSPGSNAPHGVKITMGFSPIHDIAPGLDHEGIMRAPIYNVGAVNKTFFNDEIEKK